jgi:hypothetical protein
MRRSKKPPAETGEVLLVPLENRKYGLAYVVRTEGAHAGVVMGSYMGRRLAFDEAARALRPWLREPSMRLGRLDGPPRTAARWVSSVLPPTWTRLGVIAPRAGDAKVEIDAYAGGWQNVAATIIHQWLRANDPPAAERLVAKWRRERGRADRERAKVEKARDAALTLDKLARGSPPPLPSWPKRHPAPIVREARTILRDVAREIAAAPGAREKTAALRRGVERFNTLDGKGRFQILTTEREDLCEAFLDIARAAKMKTADDPTERWRDW